MRAAQSHERKQNKEIEPVTELSREWENEQLISDSRNSVVLHEPDTIQILNVFPGCLNADHLNAMSDTR